MVNSLLSLILVATQVLSWNAAPLYLCLEADGSACLDFGPDTCGCCHDDAGSHEHSACGEHACNHAEHAEHVASTQDTPAIADAQTSRAPCGCTHVQISDPQTAALGRATVSAADFDVHHLAAIVTCLDMDAIHTGPNHAAAITDVPAAQAPLALRAGVVLRI